MLSKAKINEFHVLLILNENVLKLYISMANSFIVEIVDGTHKLPKYKSCLIFSKPLRLVNKIKQISVSAQRQDYIRQFDLLVLLPEWLNDYRMLYFAKYLIFIL